MADAECIIDRTEMGLLHLVVPIILRDKQRFCPRVVPLFYHTTASVRAVHPAPLVVQHSCHDRPIHRQA
jgi:hypothetical protein